jgi:hypothetical protein
LLFKEIKAKTQTTTVVVAVGSLIIAVITIIVFHPSMRRGEETSTAKPYFLLYHKEN